MVSHLLYLHSFRRKDHSISCVFKRPYRHVHESACKYNFVNYLRLRRYLDPAVVILVGRHWTRYILGLLNSKLMKPNVHL